MAVQFLMKCCRLACTEPDNFKGNMLLTADVKARHLLACRRQRTMQLATNVYVHSRSYDKLNV